MAMGKRATKMGSWLTRMGKSVISVMRTMGRRRRTKLIGMRETMAGGGQQ